MAIEIKIEAKDLVKKYGSLTALDGVNMQVYSGEVFGVVGPNGAGKSTLISSMAGLIRPTSGQILIDGKGFGSETKRLIGLVPQEIALYTRLSAMDNLRFWAQAYGLKGYDLKNSIEQALEVAGLADRAKDPIEQYSGGMKRRLNLAVALLHQPKILILDEPTAGVDWASRQRIITVVQQLSLRGVTVVFVSHHLEELHSVCHRFALLQAGKVAALGTAADLRDIAASQAGFSTSSQ